MPEDRQRRQRILVGTALPRDAELTVQIFLDQGLHAVPCVGLETLCRELQLGAAAVVLASELLAQSCPELEHLINDQPAWSDLPLIVLTPAQPVDEAMARAAQGRLRNVTLLERPVRIVTFLSTVRAALSARERQYEIERLLEDLKRARYAADAANRAKSQFLTNMSHEIRTPLGIILGFSELLAADLPSEEKATYLETVRRNGAELCHLIDDLLDLAKIEAEKLSIDKQIFSLAEFLDDLAATFGARAQAKGLSLRVARADQVPPFVETDRPRLRQILVNIVGNALKFTVKGRIDVDVRMITGAGGARRLAFIVKDTGLGIGEEERGRLFQPFSQADSSTTRRYGGTGLGLVLSKRLALALGGDLELSASQPGEGSTFRITIDPGSEEVGRTELKPQPLAKQASAAPLANLHQMSVLLAEDAPDGRLLLKKFLTKAGARVCLASDGAEAVAMAASDFFHVILMDLQMPSLDGFDATRKLRQLGYSRPIIALSAHAMQDERDKARAAGCDDYLTKPIDFPALVAAVETFGRMAVVENKLLT